MENHRHTLALSAGASFSGPELGRAILLVHLVLSPLLFCNDTVEAFEYPKIALSVLTAIVLAALGISEWLGRGGSVAGLRGFLRDPVAWGFVLFLMSAVASTVTSLSPRLSLRGAPESHAGLLSMLAYFGLFFATRALCRDAADARRLLAAALIGATTASVYAAVQVAGGDPIPWESVSLVEGWVRPFATLAHPNLLAGYLVMAFPVIVFFADRAVAARRWLAVAVLALAGGFLGLAIITAMSRGAWLAFACTLAICGLGLLLLGRTRRLGLGTVGVILLAGIALLIACRCTPQGTRVLESLTYRLQHFTEKGSRQHIWRAAMQLYRDQPVFGCGLDAFHLAFSQKRTVAFWTTEWNITPTRAHNELLQVLATQGLCGAIALGILALSLGYAALRAWLNASRAGRMLVLALVAGLVGFAVQNIFSFTVAGQGTLFVTLAALLSRLAATRSEEENAPSPFCRSGYAAGLILGGLGFACFFLHNIDSDYANRIPHVFWATLGVMAAFGIAAFTVWMLESREETPTALDEDSGSGVGLWIARAMVGLAAMALADSLVYQPLQADLACRQGDQLLADGRLQLAVAAYEEAVAHAPDNELYWSKLGGAARVGASRLRDPAARRSLVERGREAYARAVALQPINASYHVGLGRMFMELYRLRLAKPEQALAEYDQALLLDNNNGVYYADAANAALVMDQLEPARAYAMRGYARYPWFGLLTAHLGYVAMQENRFAEASDLLNTALYQQWYKEETARHFAENMLIKSRNRQAFPDLAASTHRERPTP